MEDLVADGTSSDSLEVGQASDGRTFAIYTCPLLVTLAMVLPTKNVMRKPLLVHVTINTPVLTRDSGILLEVKPRSFVCAALHDHLPS